MSVTDGTIANTALPTIARELHASAAESIWVVNGFQLAVTMTLLTFASLGDARGSTFVYRFGIVVFTLGSLWCALSHSLAMLVTARIAQGVGGAALMAVGPALYREIFPSNQFGRALGISGVVVATSSAAGPTLGGTVLHFAAWPWLFAVNVPLGIFDTFFAASALPKTIGSGNRLDIPSIFVSALGFGALIYGVDGFARHESPLFIAVELGLAALATFAFVRRQRALTRPMLAIDLFAMPVFTLAALTSLGTYVAQGLAYVSLPFFFQSALGRSPFESGLLLTSWPLCTALIAPIAGRLSDRYSAGVLSTIGLAIMASGLALYASQAAHPSTIEIVLHGAICGLGFGFFQSPNNRELIGSAPRSKISSASGILAGVRLTGQTLGTALVAIVFATFGTTLALGGNHLGALARTATPISLWLACASAAAGMIASGIRLITNRRNKTSAQT